ncbi:MAG: hypothetical protein P4N59_11295 [Negativicutes bacterium]|nr:hypothetical protein [Negativicutes bacterium]
MAIVSGIMLLSRSKPDKTQPPPESAPVPQPKIETNAQAKLPTIRRAQFSEDDMIDFSNRFEKRFKPEIARWCKVYGGRLPFSSNEVTLDKFNSKVGGFVYTFMIGTTTFSVYDGPQGTRVFYMMDRQAAQGLNSVPSGAVQHDISTPVTRPVITGLLKADSGIDYAADQVSIHPTGTFSSMQGGVMVEAGGITGNNVYRIMTFTNLDFVLDGNGMMVSYQH